MLHSRNGKVKNWKKKAKYLTGFGGEGVSLD